MSENEAGVDATICACPSLEVNLGRVVSGVMDGITNSGSSNSSRK